jgi:hypothetical protein
MADIRAKLPAAWRIGAAVVILAAGIVASGEVHRHHGVPLFLAAIGCGAVLGPWALGVMVGVGFGFWLSRGVVTGFWSASNPSGDNIGAEFTFAVFLYCAVAAVVILLGMGLRVLAVLIAHPPRWRARPRP